MPMTSLKGSRLISSQLEPLNNPADWEIPIRSRDTASASNSSDTTTHNAMSSPPTTSPTLAATAAAVRAQAQPKPRDVPKSGNSTQPATKDLDLDEGELKSLLDEAYSYKGPKDKANKSVLFKELLHKAEIEEQQEDTFFSSRSYRGNNRRLQTGGSLQDLVDSVQKEPLYDIDYQLGSQARHIQNNLRRTKQLTAPSTSVSSRQREGGSLPNNVNASILAGCYPVSSLSLSKYPRPTAKTSVKAKPEPVQHDYERNPTNYQRSVFISGSSGDDDGVTFRTLDTTKSSTASTSVSNANDKNHTIIDIDLEESRHSLAHDSLAQDTSETNRDDGTELVSIKKQRVPTMNFISTTKQDSGETSRQTCHVDQPIPFLKYSSNDGPSLLRSNLVRKGPIQDPASFPANRHVHLNTAPVSMDYYANPNKLDENGNAIPIKQTTATLTNANHSKSKPKRSNKADRNTTTWTVQQKQDYNIDSIVAFIENTESTKKTNIINVNKNNLSVTERNRKEKKNSGNSKKEESRLKKSTSMEELKSSSKIEEEANAQSERAQVSLRQKQTQNQQTAQKRSTTAEGKESNSKQPSNKRGERRSWGTEELNDLESIDDRDNRINKQKDIKPNAKSNSNRKTEQIASTNASIESIPTIVEAADFQVVAKKKKTKKRQIIEEAKAKQQANQRDQMQGHGRNNGTNNGNKYQPSSSYTNDREIYVNSLMAKENRRKSTSSVPPSDKSDSSDLDSVHSLPIKSTTACPSIISYAEIARKANQPEKLANVNAWPTVSQNGKNSESPENSNASTSSSVSSRSQTSNRSQDTIKALSPSEEKTQPILDDTTKLLETPKTQPTAGEYVKNQLQKSKSCDSEKYSTAAVNLDQFPGLEKTVKPQKSQPNFASVLASPPPPLPNSDKSGKTQIIKQKSVQSIDKPLPTPAETSIPKEGAIKMQKSVDEKPIETKTTVDVNSSKLVFVQNSAKVEEIVNSDSSNVFVPINIPSMVKRAKKSHSNAISTQANLSSKNHQSQRTVRQNAVIFSDHETNHENVSPLLFGDFNDDILQLMKQDENHIDDITPNGEPMMINSVADDCTNTYESAEYHAMNNDCSQSKPNNQTPMMSSKSDPAYASAHRTTVSTESHEVVGNHQIHTENHVENSTITELSNKKGNVTKKTNLNKINVNNKTSDVVSNQSLNNNNNMINNNISVGETAAADMSQTFSDSDSLNNNINIKMNDKNRNHTVDGDTIKSQQQHSDAGITKSSNAQHNVNNTISKNSNQSIAATHQQKVIITYDNVNSKSLDNCNNGPKVVPLANKRPATENDVVPVNSHPANVPHQNASFAETQVPFAALNHNHDDIVNFVGSAWEEVKIGRANYFSGQ